MKRVLITGAAGFVGRSLDSFLKKDYPSYEVYGIDVSFKKSTPKYFKIDINDKRPLRNIIKNIKPHYIFHLAGCSQKIEKFPELVSINLFGTYSLLDSVQNGGNFKTRIIIPGSAAEYGRVLRRDLPVAEEHPLNPINFYGLSKMYQTSLALSYCRRGLDIVVGRIFNISGWASPRSLSVGNFAYEISLIERGCKKPVIETKDLNSGRDFLDIKDVCSALVSIAENGRSGRAYNICSGRSYKIRDALNYLIGLSNVARIKVKSSSCGSEIKNIKGLIEKIKKDTKWEPKISISESLKNTLDYYRNIA